MMLKRKNEEDTVSEQPLRSATKRVALDADAIEEDADVDGDGDTTNSNNNNNNNNDKEIDAEGDTLLGNHADGADSSKTISSHKVFNDDPTFVHFRMLCQVKEAAVIVGKGGETISHIKDASQTSINVSDNIRGVVERVVHVKGPAEHVAKAFGLITRAILDEDENYPSSADSKVFELRILIPHPIMGYVIGKQGLKFREIENKSAAKLNTSPENMLFSTDRLLNITGVADAIHIATYYVAQTILEHKSLIKGNFLYYNPASAQQAQNQLPHVPPNGLLFNNFMNYGPPHLNQNQFLQFGGNSRFNNNPRNNNLRHRYIKQQPNHFQHFNNRSPAPVPQFQIHHGPQAAQDIYIPNEYVGNVIGKSGKNIKSINDRTGSRIDIGDPDPNSTQRKITITGSDAGNQQAILLINSKIEADRLSNEAKARFQSQNPDDDSSR